jgi:iron complex outermembrane receptor protein
MIGKTTLLAGASLALMAAAGAHAADTPAVATAPNTIEEVVVTAQKVTSNLQKTPLAITALSNAALENLHIVAPKDLDTIVPGLVVNTTPSNPLAISIRGAGYEGIENTSAQPGVSYNQNGVYIASPISLNANFLDVDTVEVLRGPQGTVLGQNSDGGAINVTTKRPELGVFTGYGDLSGGSYAYDRARAVVNLPLGDTFAVRVAVQQERHDGWAKATDVPGTNGDYPMSNENSFNTRIDALWKPIAPLTVEFWYEHYANDTNGDAFKNLLDPNPDPRELTQDWPAKMHQRSDNAALSVTYDLGWATAKLIGSYQQGKLDGSEDLDKLDYATALPILGVHDIDVVNDRAGHSYTAEADLTSKAGTKLDWIVGGFFLYQRYNEAVEEYQYNNDAENQAAYLAGAYNAYAAFGLPVNLSPTNPYYGETANFSGPVAFETRDTQKLVSGSAYAQATYHFTDKWRLTIGGRATTDNQIGVIQDYFGLLDRNNGVPFATEKAKFKRGTGRVELEYDITPLNTVYAMASNGIKPGGANLNPEAVAIPLVFAPERVDALELGSKNEFFDKTLRVNISGFYNKIHDFQVDSEDPLPFQGGLTNVKEAHVDGVEAEATELLPFGLRLDGNITVQHSRVDNHQQLLDPAAAEQIDIANGGPFNGNDVADRFAAFYAASSDVYGHQLPKVPPFTGNIGLIHNYYFANGAKLTSGVHLTYRNPYYFRIYNSPTTDLVPSQRQVDMNFSYLSANKHWHVDLVVVNVGNSDSVNSRYTDNFGTFITANYYVPPRQVIARVGYSF